MAPPNWDEIAAQIRPEIDELVKSRQQKDELLDPDPVPYTHRPNLQVCFPGYLDWLPYSADEQVPGWVWGRRRHHQSFQVSLQASINRYPDAKWLYGREVLRLLDRHIRHSATGRAILKEIGTASSHEAWILPYHPKNDDDYNADASATDVKDATSVGMPLLDSEGKPSRDAHGRPLGGGTGKGSDVRIHFTPDMWMPFSSGRSSRFSHPPTGPGTRADEVLLHELVHACRDMRGVRYRLGVNKHMDNEEEFLAVVITNIYLSEKGQTDLRASHRGYTILRDPDKFLDQTHINLQPRVLLERLRLAQFTLFQSLTEIDAPFNPVRQYDAERKAAAKRPAKAAKAS
jgi:hypothetical protein